MGASPNVAMAIPAAEPSDFDFSAVGGQRSSSSRRAFVDAVDPKSGRRCCPRPFGALAIAALSVCVEFVRSPCEARITISRSAASSAHS